MGALAALWCQPALAALQDVSLAPLDMAVGDADLSIGAQADGVVLAASGRGGSDGTGALQVMPTLKRDYDNGLSLSLNSVVALRDDLARGRYEGQNLDFLYGEARFALSRIQIGMVDGASELAVAGPKADTDLAFDDPAISLFRDPVTHRGVTDNFTLRSSVAAPSNYAKIALFLPEVFGVAVAFSFTPTESTYGVPFLHQGPQLPGRQVDIWESGARYTDTLGDVTLQAYGGFALGRAEHKLPGQLGVSDYALGLRADYPVNDDLTVSVGGAWRQTNAYAFDINQAYAGATTRSLQASTGATYKDWSFSLEYGQGIAGNVTALPRLDVNGGEAALAYAISPSLSLAGGWQRLSYTRGAGTFYNGLPHLGLDAGFLHLTIKTTPAQ